MSRLQTQWQRLFVSPDDGDSDGGAAQTRALVLALGRPADWALLSRVWRGVQAELQLPAPAIAVSGVDGHQLWFSLAVPVPIAQAQAFLTALCARYLPELLTQRIALLPEVDDAAPGGVRHAPAVPALQLPADVWSAFVAPDLAPVFDDTPWLDIPPNLDGQADLLARVDSISPIDWAQAMARLLPVPAQVPQAAASAAHTWAEDKPVAAQHVQAHAQAATPTMPACTHLDPRGFLLAVMHNEGVDLALRIEAAKALLPGSDVPASPAAPSPGGDLKTP